MRVVALSESLAVLGGGERYGLSLLAPLIGRHEVTVCYKSSEPFHAAQIRNRFALDLDQVRFHRFRTNHEVQRLAASADLFVNITYGSIAPNPSPRGILAVFFPLPLADYPAPRLTSRPGHWLEAGRQWILNRLERLDSDAFANGTPVSTYRRQKGIGRTLCRLPLFALRKLAWTGSRDLRFGVKAISSYTKVLAISEYTAHWIGRYYGCRSDMLHPPVATEVFQPGEKRNEIIAVGRFDDGENSKRLDVLIDAFRRCIDAGLLNGWRFHLCGAVHGAASEAYLARLRSQASGYPVEFHPNLPFSELAERYASAKLFWHAMGYGVNVAEKPWRCEHFGITTAEAMSAGCVPMVINAGGQPEILAEADCGYLWDTPEQLVEAVRRYLALSPPEAGQMSSAAVARAETFGHRAFFSRAIELYTELGIPCRSLEEVSPETTVEV